MAYSDKVIDHFNNPRNVGSLDKNNEQGGTGLVGLRFFWVWGGCVGSASPDAWSAAESIDTWKKRPDPDAWQELQSSSKVFWIDANVGVPGGSVVLSLPHPASATMESRPAAIPSHERLRIDFPSSVTGDIMNGSA